MSTVYNPESEIMAQIERLEMEQKWKAEFKTEYEQLRNTAISP